MRAGRRHLGFTALELLVSIVLIVLLLTILLPSLATAKQFARRQVCAANMRYTMMGVQMYSGFNQGYLPPNITFWPSHEIWTSVWDVVQEKYVSVLLGVRAWTTADRSDPHFVAHSWTWSEFSATYIDAEAKTAPCCSGGTTYIGIQPPPSYGGQYKESHGNTLRYTKRMTCPSQVPNWNMHWAYRCGYSQDWWVVPPAYLEDFTRQFEGKYLPAKSSPLMMRDYKTSKQVALAEPSSYTSAAMPHAMTSNLGFLDGHIEVAGFNTSAAITAAAK